MNTVGDLIVVTRKSTALLLFPILLCDCVSFHSYVSLQPEHARSRLILDAKQAWVWLVLGWEATWEYQLL